MKTEEAKTLMTPKKANEIADINNECEDDNWDYSVETMGKYYVVKIADEDGIHLGYF